VVLFLEPGNGTPRFAHSAVTAYAIVVGSERDHRKRAGLNESNDRDFDTAFTPLADQKIGALFAGGSRFSINQRDQVVRLFPAAHACARNDRLGQPFNSFQRR
jgi:hypothetical protein